MKLNSIYQLGPDIVPWKVELIFIGKDLVVFKSVLDGKEESRNIEFFKEFAKEIKE